MATLYPSSPPAPPSTAPATRVAIVGGGASGVLTAVNLLSAAGSEGLSVTIHEASGIVGRGIAYGTSDPRHLLNVRARHMSAWPDVPSDLLEWAARTGRDLDPQGFLPRRDYAAYLQDTLASVADHRLTVRAGRVDDIVPLPEGGYELYSAGAVSVADAVVLAYGNQEPRDLVVDGDTLPAAPWHLPNPWDLAGLHLLPGDATAVVVGTGLTAIDTTITFLEKHASRRVVMASRHGLLPFPHVGQQSTAWVSPPVETPVTADALTAFFRTQVAAAEARGVDWRAVVDGLRPQTQAIWQGMSLDERRRFLATHARFWEVRRHRMAPEVAERLEHYQAEGRLVVLSGGIARVVDRGRRCDVHIGQVGAPVPADVLVNCTGPSPDITRSSDPLLLALRERGLAAPDALHLGLATTADGALLDPDGRVVPGLYAVGPPRKGVLWESTAIPEIRGQAAEVARAQLAGLVRR
ncbi:FAD/NAD(P)-binding protein [Nocardioides sp. cx-173]|uniref:FAD/NAD(P)-binding protein n=1 Tax=Nocardioides sp. cx-173 TaxID=2898796 RepID=UPI001E57E389|nr:FAD/NAD(P)-binding protein [Nocardioides sp. cx-173]MCD4524144.1 FAD/NAD(P)-binding protein [Nocardioides sp. cx-173]UGB41540.1 FAD/NAD(P)-binding protein [Nocardioides sp. cx-173]